MLKKFILVLVTLFILVSCYNQEKNCTDFKTGRFTFETYLNGEVVKTTFTRNDTLEIDFYQGQVDSSNIRWINDCEYIAEKINPTGIMDRKALHFKILTTKDNTYTFEYALVGETKKQKGTVTKIE
ncbi:DNA topoisomerase IV [Leeuwenhoekiella marinoflava]|uniref:DNA topoisomerase IV n=1 Tax=Leeuwenhoekiella marinoflava TaxID=988 RepID=UPI003003639E